jgi:ABC-type hemin transport system ATPase subunit
MEISARYSDILVIMEKGMVSAENGYRYVYADAVSLHD